MNRFWRSLNNRIREILGFRLSERPGDRKMKGVVPSKYGGNSDEFHLREYECLRKEIELLLGEYFALERNTLFVVGITIAWLFHEGRGVPPWSWFIPLLFTVFGFLRFRCLNASFEVLHSYIQRIEIYFSIEGCPGGWEHFSRSQYWTSEGLLSFWSSLIFVTAVIGIFEMWPSLGHKLLSW